MLEQSIACSFGPFRAIYGVLVAYPGRRCALPWAKLFKPVGLNSKETQPTFVVAVLPPQAVIFSVIA